MYINICIIHIQLYYGAVVEFRLAAKCKMPLPFHISLAINVIKHTYQNSRHFLLNENKKNRFFLGVKDIVFGNMGR